MAKKFETAIGLEIDQEVANPSQLRNLVDGWIVPKMVDEFIEQMYHTKSVITDNGEHK